MTGTVYSWNPVRPVFTGRIGKRIPLRRPVNNFGDLIGPLVVKRLVERHGLTGPPRRDLFSVGSVMHFATPGSVVWGTGINGKVADRLPQSRDVDVRAVRGPRTRDLLVSNGMACPEVYGDPALLLPQLLPEMTGWRREPLHDVTVVPNLHDWRALRERRDVLNPRSPLRDCLKRIAQSRLVVGSSLHGVIVAESLGIPARLVLPGAESLFKYEDHYLGTGRSTFTPGRDPDEAIRLGGEPPIRWDPQPLLSAFPVDLWTVGPATDHGAPEGEE